MFGTSLGVQWLRLHDPSAGPLLGNQTSCAVWDSGRNENTGFIECMDYVVKVPGPFKALAAGPYHSKPMFLL